MSSSSINFPSNPTMSQPYSFNGTTWIFNGYAWVAQQPSGATGPQGSQGPQGDIGATGPQGPAGTQSNLPFLENKTLEGSTNVINIDQSIFNPSDLTIATSSQFIVEINADYYILGDLFNNGILQVDGTLKVGGLIYNTGAIIGTGIIE